MTPQQFAPIWLRMLRAWPATKPVEGTASEYAARLAAFEPAEVAAVVDRLVCTAEWFPPIAAVWRLCLEGRDRAPSWVTAWREALEHAAGTDRPWTHPAVADAYHAIGGWSLRTQPSGEVATRAQFRDAYQLILDDRRDALAAGQLPLPPAPRPALEPR